MPEPMFIDPTAPLPEGYGCGGLLPHGRCGTPARSNALDTTAFTVPNAAAISASY